MDFVFTARVDPVSGADLTSLLVQRIRPTRFHSRESRDQNEALPPPPAGGPPPLLIQRGGGTPSPEGKLAGGTEGR